MADIARPANPSFGGARGEVRRNRKAAETITAGDAVVLDSNGLLVAANATTDDAYAWIALNSAVAGEAVDVMELGAVTGWANLTPGTVYYLSKNADGRICPVADLSDGDNFVPVGIAESATVLYVTPAVVIQLPNSTLVIASPARGNIAYYGASGWTKLANGAKGYPLVSGGSGADPSYAAPRQVMHVGPLADQGADATVTVKLGAPATGRKWVVTRVHVLSGTTADVTANLKFAGTTALAAPVALDGDTEITAFADSEAAAGQAVTLDLVTAADTGDLDAAVIIFEFADLPA